MSYGSFTCKINLGNEFMGTPLDVALALSAIVTKMTDGETGGGVMDGNGNSVGYWELEVENDA